MALHLRGRRFQLANLPCPFVLTKSNPRMIIAGAIIKSTQELTGLEGLNRLGQQLGPFLLRDREEDLDHFRVELLA